MKITSNIKYLSKNPINRYLINNFTTQIQNIISTIDFTNAIDLGCGEGYILHKLYHLFENKNMYGLDISEENILAAKENVPSCIFQIGSIYNTVFSDNQFDLVICNEVLEHLDNPQNALIELHRISNKYLVISVPNEPIWRIMNMIRGKYILQLGNTPTHINHWSPEAFIKFVSMRFNIIKTFKPLPWTILLAQKQY